MKEVVPRPGQVLEAASYLTSREFNTVPVFFYDEDGELVGVVTVSYVSGVNPETLLVRARQFLRGFTTRIGRIRSAMTRVRITDTAPTKAALDDLEGDEL